MLPGLSGNWGTAKYGEVREGAGEGCLLVKRRKSEECSSPKSSAKQSMGMLVRRPPERERSRG